MTAMHVGYMGHLVQMGVMGLLVSVVAPAVVLGLLRAAPSLDRATVPAAVAFPAFAVLHAVVTMYTHGPVPPVADVVAHVALLVGAVLFWAPVLGVRRRLPDGVRAVYLYAAMPVLDLAGVWVVAVGDNAGGLAMIVGMLPMALAAVVITWRWISAEERCARLEEAREDGRHPVLPATGRSEGVR